MFNRIIKLGLISLAVVGLASLTLYRISVEKAGQQVSGPGAFGPPIVKAQIVKTRTVQNHIQATGSVIANEEVDVHSEISGRIVRIYFQEGTRVSKGELLVKINDSELQAQLQRSKSRLALSVSQEKRQKALFEQNLASQNDYDIALNELNANRADIELIEAQLEKTEIRSPFDGVIGLKYVSEGSFISSSTRIATIQDLSAIKIDFAIPEKYSGQVRMGSMIKFTTEESGNEFTGRIYARESKIDVTTRTLQLRAISNSTYGMVLPGSFAKIDIVLTETPNAILIPTQAIIPELKGQRVFLLKGGKAFSQKVETGMRTESEVQVTDGITSGDTLIVSGIMQIRSGAEVNISEIID